MVIQFDLSSVNLLGVLLGSFADFCFCYIWFDILFPKQILKYCGWTEEEAKKNSAKFHTGRNLLTAYTTKFITAFVLALVVHSLEITTTFGVLKLCAILWFGFMATVSMNEVLWHGEKFEYYLVNQIGFLVCSLGMAFIYSLIAL